MSKQQQLDDLNKEWSAKALPLQAGATQAVPGEGNPDADILFVGEGPGKDEDEQGRPFVGAAGKFLTNLIGSIGLKREEVFIANMVKHRPPGNRDPLPEELAAYAPWLDRQVAIIQPKLIVTLGRYSMAHFLGETLSISKIHGQAKRNKKGQVVIPMYHPAAALYRGNLRPVLLADFQKILKVLALITQGSPVNEEEDQKEAVSHQKQAALF
ncbi:MAG TPA: uracil-DNA glycosylase [Candidatus Andersenbacteria bacterium]|nr:MAG: Phage SPO1 DNA polymerase-related protein [Parcubacteria group bacterium GW2011_GWA2_45_14]HBE89714.1 uracil-DNA glycosylase [Candidatus Andersenbacteria bacterium]